MSFTWFFKLGPLIEKWLNNQVDQILESPGIFRKYWGGRGILEKKKKNSCFLITLIKVLEKSCWVNSRNSYRVNWIMAHLIFSSYSLLKVTVFMVHNNKFFQTGKNCVCGVKFGWKLESYKFVNKYRNWSIFSRCFWNFQHDYFFFYF